MINLNFFLLLLLFPTYAFAKFQSIDDFSVTVQDAKAGNNSTYIFSFHSQNYAIQNTDTLIFTLPDGFQLAGLVGAASDTEMTGGFDIETDGQRLLLGRDGTGNLVASGTPVKIIVGVIGNQDIAGSAYTVSLSIKDAAGNVQEPLQSSDTFTIVANDLDHFSITETDDSVLGDQTAGSAFNIKITALDAYNNVATSFGGTATLADLTSSISPETTGTFSAGVLASHSVTIPKSLTNNVITVTGNSRSGSSGSFDVKSGALDHFSISPVTGQQTAGTNFTIEIVAQDVNNNTVTDFTGTVDLSTSVGTITPVTTNTFTAGVLTNASVSLTAARNNADIIATDTNTGKTGTSNAFVVIPGALHHFNVLPIATSQVSGVPFDVTLTAQDINNNTVASYAGTAAITSNNGTISPSVTGNFINGIRQLPVTSETPATNQFITFADGSIQGISNTFNVANGPATSIIIRTAQNNNGVPLNDLQMTADETVEVWAAGYDASGAYIGDQAANWSLVGGIVGEVGSASGATNFVFNPTLSGVSGRIRAVHATGGFADESGDITVSPGAPANLITLTPAQTTLPADGISTTTITSTAVTDADGNNVGAGKEFTVNVTPGTSGTIPVNQDNNPAQAGVQISTIASGQLTFTFQASLVGGAATIYTSSVQGVSSGETSVNVGSIDLISVAAVQPQVSRGQTARVAMVAKNVGATDFIITDADLNFVSGGFDRNGDYPDRVRVDNFTDIPSGVTRTLLFDIKVSENATVDTVTINGSILGTINGSPISDNVAETLSGWRVKIPANPQITVVTAPTVVSQAQGNIPVTVEITNSEGQDAADFILTEAGLIFKIGANDVTAQYQVSALGTNPDRIAGGGRATFSFAVNVAGTADLGNVTVDGNFSGRDSNLGLNIDEKVPGAFSPGQWNVSAGAALQIAQINTPQSVTALEQGPWEVEMVLQNSSDSDIQLDLTSASTYIRFFSGIENVTAKYRITKPIALLNSGTTTLANNTSDILVFTIDSTGGNLGNNVITGGVTGIDLQTSLAISDDTGDDGDVGKGSVNVQSPADLQITGINLSQPTVNIGAGQTTPWKATVLVRNNGQADAKIDFTNAGSFLSLANDAGYNINLLANFSTNGDTLAGNSSDSLEFQILGTGTDPGVNLVNAKVSGIELNRGLSIFDSTSTIDGNQASFVVQTPASFLNDSTYAEVPNPGFVNAGDTFSVNVQFANTGQEQVDNLVVQLATDGGSSIQNSNRAELQALPGESKAIATFTVKANANLTAAETFTASFVSAKSNNTNASISPALAQDSIAVIQIQKAAQLAINNVIPSEVEVTAGNSAAWLLLVEVTNSGDAPIDFDPPAPDDISFVVNEIPANPTDFVVEPPTQLNNSGTLRLAGGLTDTLTYTVARTGPTGGAAKATATISAKDANNGTVLTDIAEGLFSINTSAVIRIVRTRAVNDAGEPIQAVNVNSDNFNVRVVLQNPGIEIVEQVGVQLTTTGGAIITPRTTPIAQISPLREDSLTFKVRGAGQINLNGEIFRASISSAIAQNGIAAKVDRALDDTAKVVTNVPAQLAIAAATDPITGKVTLGQAFTVTATVSNILGGAPIDNSGLVTLELPASGNYTLIDIVNEPPVRSFELNNTISWRVQAPTEASIADSFKVTITQAPKDRNSGATALLLPDKGTDAAVVDTDFLQFVLGPIYLDGHKDDSPDTVSTNQYFVVVAEIDQSTNVNGATATLILPPGSGYEHRFSRDDATQVIPVGSTSVSWQVTAPNSATGVVENFVVRIQAAEIADAEGTRGFITEKAATLRLSGTITAPTGAQSGSLSKGQNFTLSVSMQNTGDAATSGDTRILLDTGDTGVTALNGGELAREIPVDGTITYELVAPGEPKPKQPLKIKIISKPMDINSGNVAADEGPIEVFVETRDGGNMTAGNLVITSPVGAASDSVLSTGQSFQLKADLSWENAANIKGKIIFPEGSGYIADLLEVPATSTIPSGSESFIWNITAPSTARTLDSLSVVFSGTDAANPTVLPEVSTTKLPLTIMPKAQINFVAEITNPTISAKGRSISPDVIFTVTATVGYMDGGAATEGESNVQISLPVDYALENDGDSEIKSTIGGIASWEIRSPVYPHEDTRQIDVRIINGPTDENTGEIVNIIDPKRNILIRTKSSTLEVHQLNLLRTSTVVKGQENITMLRVMLLNSAEEGRSSIVLDSLAFQLFDGEDTEINASSVVREIVVESDDALFEYGRTNSGLDNSVIRIGLARQIELLPQIPDSIAIRVSLVNTAGSSGQDNFKMKLSGGSSIAAREKDSGKKIAIALYDSQQNQGNALSSLVTIVLDDDFASTFKNFPNPFNPNRPPAQTEFRYNLKESANVTLKILTLFGEPVYEVNYAASTPEGSASGRLNTIYWDGKNGKGEIVMNGVYLAVITTSNGDIATRKVAVIK